MGRMVVPTRANLNSLEPVKKYEINTFNGTHLFLKRSTYFLTKNSTILNSQITPVTILNLIQFKNEEMQMK